MHKHPTRLQVLLSGSYDGEVRVWNLPQRTCEHSFLAHDGIVRGIVFLPSSNHFITIGDDKTIKTWKAEAAGDDQDLEPTNTIISKVRTYQIHSPNPVTS
jgi:WD repeat and SOF domain-containing protein 1